jgi:competence ComEA-like helix-hairpin-helix protein
MWGREMRAGLVFVLVSLVAGSAFREWKRTNEVRFADLIRDLESADGAARPRRSHAAGGAAADSLQPAGQARVPGESSPKAPSRHRPERALRPGGIDVDRASAAELERLPGIGPSLAARIVAERDRSGPFRGAEALLRVPGIGPRILERIRPYLTPARAPADSGSPIAN